jgi:hypothetical protein
VNEYVKLKNSKHVGEKDASLGLGKPLANPMGHIYVAILGGFTLRDAASSYYGGESSKSEILSPKVWF